jgi:hypothetical protein
LNGSSRKYYIYRIYRDISDLEEIAKKLKTSNHVREYTYFDDKSETQKLELRSRFQKMDIEESVLRGSAIFETAVQITDIEEKYTVQRKANKVDFFISLSPIPHLIINNDANLSNVFSKLINAILFENKRNIKKVKLTHEKILKFLGENRCVLKGNYMGTSIQGVNTLGLFGSNVTKSPEISIIQRYLTEHKAIKPLLEDYGWTIWLSSKTGVLYCLDSHDQNEFIEFIKEKIIPLCV